MTWVWSAASRGEPSGYPIGNGTTRARGGFTLRVISGSVETETLAIPTPSRALWISPTD